MLLLIGVRERGAAPGRDKEQPQYFSKFQDKWERRLKDRSFRPNSQGYWEGKMEEKSMMKANLGPQKDGINEINS